MTANDRLIGVDEMQDSKRSMQAAEQATFTPTALPGLPFMLPACDVCGAYVARREVHEEWHRQFVHTVDMAVDVEWVVKS